MNKERIHQISEKIFSLFVVNTSAAGIQQKDGKYITKYIPISPTLIENMILSHGSMGCYQQGYKTGYIKWICLDFDCRDKNNPDVEKLFERAVYPVTAYLDKKGIRYLTEFSGRRGIHIWIIFDSIIKKATGFRILKEIIKNVDIDLEENNNEWNLDLFPATDSSHNNIVGKQVKFPLSAHKAGGISYFFSSAFNNRSDQYTDAFFNDQYLILNNYQENQIEKVMRSLGVSELYEREYKYKYKRYHLLGAVNLTIDEVWATLTQTRVFSELYNRMKKGQALPQDWTVVLGTLSPCDPDGTLIRAIFKEFPNYDEYKTTENLKRLKDKYFPATFGYLYHIYELDIEENLDPDITGLVYLLRNNNIDNAILKELEALTEKKTINNIYDTICKEKNYLLYNDEAPDIYTWNQLNLIKQLDVKMIEAEIQYAIGEGVFNGELDQFRIFERHESEEKTRKLISLSARDRVITTQLALLFCQEYKHQWKTFSYRPSLISRNDIFYAWYKSWGNYISKIRSFLEVPFFDDYEVLFIDLKSFYDNIDFLTVFETIKSNINDKAKSIMRYLIGFNDSLMSLINAGVRKGVPQGPAYARIIAELFMDQVLLEVEKLYGQDISLYRYVDDIVVICRPEFDSKSCFAEIRNKFSEYGLPVNMEKSQCFGKIGSLTNDQKAILLHSDNFNYDLRYDVGSVLLTQERKQKLNHFLSEHSFDMRSLGYIFGSRSLQEAKEWCFNEYREQIISSEYGRGSNFRRFYQFIFSHDEYLQTAIDENLFELIPYGTVNISNFIDELYLSVQEKRIDSISFERIKEEALFKFNREKLDMNDAAVIDALMIIQLEALDNE